MAANSLSTSTHSLPGMGQSHHLPIDPYAFDTESRYVSDSLQRIRAVINGKGSILDTKPFEPLQAHSSSPEKMVLISPTRRFSQRLLTPLHQLNNMLNSTEKTPAIHTLDESNPEAHKVISAFRSTALLLEVQLSGKESGEIVDQKLLDTFLQKAAPFEKQLKAARTL